MGGQQDLLELCRQLKQERLFISSEKEQLQQLHSSIAHRAEQLYHLSWIARQQKTNLNQLILADRDVTPEVCCRRSNVLESTCFKDGYKVLSYHEAKIGEFLKHLRESPKLVSACLVQAEKDSHECLQRISRIAVTGLYGNSVMQEDELLVLQLLKSLIDIQLALSDNPRRMLRKGSCAFSLVFKLLNESMFSAKLFLTAALHKPVMQLLMEDEWFYDIDPDRALYRFPPHERKRRFGEPGTDEYAAKTKEYRGLMTDKLVTLAEFFINSLKSTMHCFPQSLAWIVSQLFHTLTKQDNVTTTEAKAMCADLILALFICPAVCDPEPYGITSDVPISYIARHNLMQVAQILQVLAICEWEETDPKTKDLYDKFQKGCMSFLLDSLLDTPCTDSPPQTSGSQLPGIGRSAVLLTCSEVVDLIAFQRNWLTQLSEDHPDRKLLMTLLTDVPPNTTLQNLLPGSSHGSASANNSTPQPTPPGTPPSAIKKLNKNKERKKGSLFLNADSAQEEQAEPVRQPPEEDVLIISLGVVTECPGMMSEQKVLEQENRQRKVKYNSLLPGEDDPVSESEIHLHEKRTRFSLSHDQDSIATSDNLEAISEAASSHSVGSDMDDNENDNLSDMVSANVSGRGTPNISGRDTPVSQPTGASSAHFSRQVESNVGEGEERRAPDLPVTVQKRNREDVTDRFGKFEIKHELERDDMRSTVSDTWSTDVLASDSEPPEQNQLERLEEVAEEMARQNLLGVQEVCEISETASDAWSTDVLASDTSERQSDRLLELEQDDAASVSSRVPDDTTDTLSETSQGATGGPKDEELGAVGSATSPGSPPELASAFENSPVKPTAIHGGGDASVIRNRHSAPMREKTADMNRPQCVSNIAGAFDPVGSQAQFGSPQRDSSSFKYTDGRVAKVLHGFEAGNHEESSSDPALHEDGFLEAGSMHSNLASSVSTLVAESSVLSPDNDDSTLKRGQELVDLDQSTDSVVESGGLKLTELQNFSIDANRLSAAIELFDPLMQENASSDRRMSDPVGSSAASQGNPFNRMSYQESSHSKSLVDPSLPKIALKLNSLDITEETVTKPPIRRSPLNSSSEQDTDDSSVHSGMSDKPCVPNGDVAKSQSGASAALQIDNPPIDNRPSPQKPEQDDDRLTKDQAVKKKSSFFSSFKERLRQGPFPMQVPMVGTRGGGKRGKFGKVGDRDDNIIARDDRGVGADGRPYSAPADSGDDVFLSSSAAVKSKVLPYRPQSEDPSTESSDDILAKYRRSAAPQKQPTDFSPPSRTSDSYEDDSTPAYDPHNLESCKAFTDAKRKLRLVLSTADFHSNINNYVSTTFLRGSCSDRKDNDLVSLLKIQLAEAINLQDKDLIAQLHETIRCLRQFDNQEVRKLLRVMREEYRSRSPYIAYLVRCRQGMLSSEAYLDRMLDRIQRDKSVVNKYFLSVFVRLFLQKRERSVVKFIADFQKLTVMDEKADLVEKYLNHTYKRMEEDSVWHVASEAQHDQAKVYIERNIMSHIYTHAMFPNGDGDIMRDQILHDHIKKLSQVIRPSHKDLRILKVYHGECPWPAAQSEIYMISAYKTPKDKLRCVLRSASTVMNLLRMANEKSVPAADDFMPVFIYVLIKANPSSLLSTIQYVNSFYEKRLEGEEQYWWMQFIAAVEFIKTMDYGV